MPMRMKHILMAPLRVKIKIWIIGLILCVVLADYFGLFLKLQETDFDSKFSYPLNGNVRMWATELKNGEKPAVEPIYKHNYMMLKHAKAKCLDSDGTHYVQLRVVYIIKSAMEHFERRQTIRRTWGFEKRFSDVNIRTVFLLGRDEHFDADLQAKIEAESKEFRDIVQGDFIDTYYNNTLKTLMGLRWAVEQCPTSRFYFMADDDYYISTKNVLRFLRNPVDYPGYLTQPVLSFDEDQHLAEGFKSRNLKQLVDFDLPEDVELFAGTVFKVPPIRAKCSKWFITLEEYPYNYYPPYVTAGANVLSRKALMDMYYASYFVKPFKFDDIYLAIIAKKLGIEPFHCDQFKQNRERFSRSDWKYLVASHGFSNPKELEKIWNEQKMAGNA